VTRHSDARDRIVRATASLLASKGYFGTGLNEIITRSDAPKGSLYHYFPAGKTAMVCAAVEFVGAEVAAALEHAASEPPHARNQLQVFAGILRRWLLDSDFNESCPVFATAVNLGLELADVQQVSMQALAHWRGCIEQALARDGLGEADANGQAYLLIAALEGALGLARLERSTAPLNLVERQLLASLPA
jgi:TetR/AcrR family transcriptional repressor of lmrAB and yxaGH operons